MILSKVYPNVLMVPSIYVPRYSPSPHIGIFPLFHCYLSHSIFPHPLIKQPRPLCQYSHAPFVPIILSHQSNYSPTNNSCPFQLHLTSHIHTIMDTSLSPQYVGHLPYTTVYVSRAPQYCNSHPSHHRIVAYHENLILK